MTIFGFKFLFILMVVRAETTTIGKLVPLTFWLHPVYFYDGATLLLEIALDIDQPWPTCGKLTKSFQNLQILALNIRIFQKFGPRTDLGWPWLI
jgi:hypothetical protein